MITKEQALKALIEFNHNWSETVLKEVLDRIPDEDVAPVVHAHWINARGPWIKTCSNCETEDVSNGVYCPNCGAKMDEEIK